MRFGLANTIQEVQAMSVGEYSVLLRVYKLKQLDKQQDYIDDLITKRTVNATDKKGNYKYTKSSQLINFNAEADKIIFNTKSKEEQRKEDAYAELTDTALRVREFNEKFGGNY